MTGYKTGFYSPQRGGFAKYPSLWRGCVGAWSPSLGPTGSTLFDQSVYRKNGTLTNMDPGTDWVASEGKYALKFTGASEQVRATGITGTIDKFSIALWVYCFDPSGTGYFVNTVTDGDFRFGNWINATTSFLTHNGSNVTYTHTSKVDKWLHHAYSWNGTDSKIYVNGNLVKEWSTFTVPASLSPIQIGNRFSGARSPNSLIDETRLYDRVVTPSEFRTLSLRRGIAYERASRRRAYVAGGGFQAAWAANSNVVMSI